MTSDETRAAKELNDYWDARLHGAIPAADERDPVLAAAIEHLYHLDDAPGPDAAFAERLRERLTGPPERPAPVTLVDWQGEPLPVPPAMPAANGRATRRPAYRRDSRFTRAANGLVAAVLLVALVGALALVGENRAWSGAGDPRPTPTRAGQAVGGPTAAASPQSSVCPEAQPRDVNAQLACVFRVNPAFQQMMQDGLFREVNEAQTVDGFTITLRRVYADANVILVAYTLEMPVWVTSEERIAVGPLQLVDSAGRTYQGTQSGAGFTTAQVFAFDATALPAGTSAETFTLTVGSADVRATPPVGSQPTPGSCGPNCVVVQPATPGAQLATAGPWRFTFTVPVIPARVAEVHQAVTVTAQPRLLRQSTPVAAGVPPAQLLTITRERVIVTPSETRVILTLPAPPDQSGGRWNPIVHLSGPGWDSRNGARGSEGSGPVGDGTVMYTFHADNYDRPDDWQVTVDELVATDPTPGIGQQLRVTGPWVFHLTVPAP